jgi:DNA-binding CsgD family transcriptional regulator
LTCILGKKEMARKLQLDEKVRQLCSGFYDILLGDCLWEQALEPLLPIFRGTAVHLFLLDREKNLIDNLAIVGRFSQKSLDNYTNYYGKFDPRGQYIAQQAAGSIVPCREICDTDYVKHSEIFQDFLLPNGLRYTIAATPAQRGPVAAIVGFMRPEQGGDYSELELAAFRPLMHHLGRALQLRWRLDGLYHEVFVREQALNALAFAVLVVDAKGRISHLNSSAENVLKQMTVLKVVAGHLKCHSISNQSNLLTLLANALCGIGGGLRLRDSVSERKWNFWAVPARHDTTYSSEPQAILVISNWESPPQIDALLRHSFGFTKAESKLAQALASGCSVAEYAERSAISIATVRTQMRAIYDKAGVSGQTELVRLLANAGLTHA